MVDNYNVCLTFETKIWLYAENFITREYVNNLRKKDFFVKGIIDRKYKEQWNDDQNHIWHGNLNSARIDENDVFIVCLMDGSKHDAIAKSIYEKGGSWILYLPMYSPVPISDQRVLRKSYYCFVEGLYDRIIIPRYQVISTADDELRIIERMDYAVSFWCPKRFLRCASKDYYEKAAVGRGINAPATKYCGCKIEENIPYIELFEILSEGNLNIQEVCSKEYFLCQRNSDEERIELFENRKKLYIIYEDKLKYDMTFFLDSPAKVKWNPNGFFNIEDGLHRIYYLNSKGYELYPVVVSVDDFESFLLYYEHNSVCKRK